MKILIISQVFWPDNVSVSQHLTDLAVELSHRKHKVKVISSIYQYENPKVRYKNIQYLNDVAIIRLWTKNFSKASRVGRFLNFMTFNIMLAINLLKIKPFEYDCIIGLTAPPMVSVIGALIGKIKKIKFFYWTMDLQPELSISCGYIKEKSLVAKMLIFLGKLVFDNSRKIIALDKYMEKHIKNRLRKTTNMDVVPVWPVVSKVFRGERLANPFRIKNNFGDKTVIMYSGNHSVVHPLETLLNCAYSLRNNENFLFVFIGGGIRKKEVTLFINKHQLKNIIQLPFQDRSTIHLSLSSADIQVVIMGENQVGFTHPNKIYGAMFLGKPILYIGPRPSHITDILEKCPGNIRVNHGESEKLKNELIYFLNNDEQEWAKTGQANKSFADRYLAPQHLLERMVHSIESA